MLLHKYWEADFCFAATARLSSMIQGYDWTIEDTYAAQNMCPYETVSLLWSHSMGLPPPGNDFSNNDTDTISPRWPMASVVSATSSPTKSGSISVTQSVRADFCSHSATSICLLTFEKQISSSQETAVSSQRPG